MFPELALIDAVGVPELTLMNANLAEEVEPEPKSRSTLDIFGVITPFVIFQFDPPEPEHELQVGAPPPLDVKHSPRFPAPVWDS